jgi:hypothetical protein
MHGSISYYEHDEPSDETRDTRFKMNLSHVYLDDDGHIIAVFEDETEMDVTELFDVVKQS